MVGVAKKSRISSNRIIIFITICSVHKTKTENCLAKCTKAAAAAPSQPASVLIEGEWRRRQAATTTGHRGGGDGAAEMVEEMMVVLVLARLSACACALSLVSRAAAASSRASLESAEAGWRRFSLQPSAHSPNTGLLVRAGQRRSFARVAGAAQAARVCL